MVGAAVLLIALSGFSVGNTSILDTAANVIIQFEGFRGNPYWDVSRYSWGYGTRAPGSTGTITREQARAELEAYVTQDYEYLQQLITRALTVNQWAALLSFSYNLGKYNADNLVANINANDDVALHNQWMQYVNSGGQYDPDLADRRAREWEIWIS